MRRLAVLIVVGLLAACSSAPASTTSSAPDSSVASAPASTTVSASDSTTVAPVTGVPPADPRWQHVVIVVEENRNSTSILSSPDAPYLNQLAAQGLSLTDMHGETHPSQPNYLALLSGSTQGLTDDSCPHTYAAANLAAQLLAAGRTFVGYSESLPKAGYTGCDAYPYARRHVPWVNFTDLPATVNQPLTAFPTDFAALPTLSFVIPNVRNDMHDGTIAQGDAWLRAHLSGYAAWARTHHSMLLVTWDEDEGSNANHIATIAVGQGIAPGTWTPRADHYTLLAALEQGFGLARLGAAAQVGALPPLG